MATHLYKQHFFFPSSCWYKHNSHDFILGRFRKAEHLPGHQVAQQMERGFEAAQQLAQQVSVRRQNSLRKTWGRTFFLGCWGRGQVSQSSWDGSFYVFFLVGRWILILRC